MKAEIIPVKEEKKFHPFSILITFEREIDVLDFKTCLELSDETTDGTEMIVHTINNELSKKL